MSSTYGEKIKISVFGESHGNGIGVVIDGLSAGAEIDMDGVLAQMKRRAPGRDKTATPRKESDLPEVLSGMLGSTLTGAPLCSDYTAFIKYGGANDIRGGGHFSGRITAPLVFAGSICRQLLEKRGIKIAAHIKSIGGVNDKAFEPTEISDKLIDRLNSSSFALIDEDREEAMRAEVESARKSLDSIGGTIECAVTAVKGIEFGKGFELAKMRGSQSNDPFVYMDGRVVTETNNCGGILGGITNGMPVIFTAAIKPTPSIAQKQRTVNLETGENTELEIRGRHDPCIVPRAVPVIEAVTAIALINLI